MDDLANVRQALTRLGAEPCANCGSPGAKSLCLGCRTVSYCGKACQKVAWPSHKRECRRIVREKAKIRDGIAAACAADEAIAADACRTVCRTGIFRLRNSSTSVKPRRASSQDRRNRSSNSHPGVSTDRDGQVPTQHPHGRGVLHLQER